MAAPAPAARFLLATVLFQLIGFFLPQLDSGQLTVAPWDRAIARA